MAPVVASIDTGVFVALATASGTAVTALGAAVVGLLKSRADAKRQARMDALDEWQSIVKEMKGQLERQGAVIRQQQEVIDSVVEEASHCREDYAEQRGWLRQFHDLALRFAEALKKLGQDQGEVPPLPPERSRHEERHQDTLFLMRQAKQSVNLLSSAESVIEDKVKGVKPGEMAPPGGTP